MRHRVKRFRLNRVTSWRKATITSLARNLLIHQSIKTTEARAKASREVVDQLITLAKKNTLAAKRAAFRILGDHALVKMLFADIGPRFQNRAGGYTRVLHLGHRRGDNASIVIFELTEIKKKEPTKKQKKEKNEKGARPDAVAKEKTKKDDSAVENKQETRGAVEEKPTHPKKPTKKFLSGIRGIFKKERDSL